MQTLQDIAIGTSILVGTFGAGYGYAAFVVWLARVTDKDNS